MPPVAVLTLAVALLVRTEPVSLATPTGTLHGSLDLPPGGERWPVVVLHPGSGPTDRDGNQPHLRNDSLKHLGRGLALRGIACLRIDKRGVAASRKALAKEEDASIDGYAADAAAWVKLLRADGRFPKVGFVGHSEGSLVGLIASRSEPSDAFVSLCGPGRRLSNVLREQLKPKFSKELYARSDAILTELEASRTVADVPKDLFVLFRPSVQPFLISLFRRDPATEIVGLKCPMLIVEGTADIQIATADADALAAARKDARRLTVRDMNHVLKRMTFSKSLLAQTLSYMDPRWETDPRLIDGVAAFLVETIGGK